LDFLAYNVVPIVTYPYGSDLCKNPGADISSLGPFEVSNKSRKTSNFRTVSNSGTSEMLGMQAAEKTSASETKSKVPDYGIKSTLT
jgi:hypothetical protein